MGGPRALTAGHPLVLSDHKSSHQASVRVAWVQPQGRGASPLGKAALSQALLPGPCRLGTLAIQLPEGCASRLEWPDPLEGGGMATSLLAVLPSYRAGSCRLPPVLVVWTPHCYLRPLRIGSSALGPHLCLPRGDGQGWTLLACTSLSR